MKKQMIKISSLLFVMVAMMLSACDDYLDDVPKGQKIPKTWEDYNAFIRNNFSYHFLDPDQLAVLAGDIFKLPSAVTSPSLTRANYYADESVNRIDLMTGNDKNPYFNAYEGLFAWNLIVEDVPDATECTEIPLPRCVRAMAVPLCPLAPASRASPQMLSVSGQILPTHQTPATLPKPYE